MPPLYQQQPKEVTITWRFWSITTATTNTMLTIIIIIIPNKHSSWWRRLEDVVRLRLQNVLIKTNIFALRNTPRKNWTFFEKAHIEKFRNSWNEITKKYIFFLFPTVCIFDFCKIWTPVFAFYFWLINLWRK